MKVHAELDPVCVEIVKGMEELGIHESRALALVGEFGAEVCSEQLRHLPMRGARNPAAVLISSIEQRWGPPQESARGLESRVVAPPVFKRREYRRPRVARDPQAALEELRSRVRSKSPHLLKAFDDSEGPHEWEAGAPAGPVAPDEMFVQKVIANYHHPQSKLERLMKFLEAEKERRLTPPSDEPGKAQSWGH